MSFDQKALWVLTFIFLICGFTLLCLGNVILPDNAPANELASWLHPGVLIMVAGLIGLCSAIGSMWMLNQK